jgi:hypothetical protein
MSTQDEAKFQATLERARQSTQWLRFDAVPSAAAADIAKAIARAPHPGDWRAASAWITLCQVHPSGEIGEVTYAWKDHQGEVRADNLDDAVKAWRLWPESAPILRRLAQVEDDYGGMNFLLVYDTQSRSHGVVSAYLSRYPGDSLHIAEAMALGATTPKAREGLARLEALSRDLAFWLTMDAIVRGAFPDAMEANEHRYYRKESGRAQAVRELHTMAKALRALPPLRGAKLQAMQLLRNRAPHAATLPAETLAELIETGELRTMRPSRALAFVLEQWPADGNTDQRAAAACEAFLERIAGLSEEELSGRIALPLPEAGLDHVGQQLAAYATTPASREGLTRLGQLPPEDAYWLALDVVVRVEFPAAMDADIKRVLASHPDGPILRKVRQMAADLRRLPPLPESCGPALEILREQVMHRATELTRPLAGLVSQGRRSSNDALTLLQLLQRWPGESGDRLEIGARVCTALLERVASHAPPTTEVGATPDTEPPPKPQPHVAQLFVEDATRDRLLKGHARLQQMRELDAFWFVLDVVVRVLLPQELDRFLRHDVAGAEEPDLLQIATDLRGLAGISVSKNEAEAILRRPTKLGSASFLVHLADAMRDESLPSLELALSRWPSRFVGQNLLDWVADPRVVPG